MNIFLTTPIKIATTEANNADWNNATEASEAANASIIPLNENGELIIISWAADGSPPIIALYPL